MERNPEQIRKRQAEIKSTADRAMGQLAILTAAAQIGDGDAGKSGPPSRRELLLSFLAFRGHLSSRGHLASRAHPG
jgi:hypothetical protein